MAFTDDRLLPLAEQLLDCLCVQLAETPGGPVCRCCLHPGPVPADFCCDCSDADGPANGQAGVRIVSQYPSRTFPAADTTVLFGCPGFSPWAGVLEMVVHRCVHVVDDRGRPPSCEQLTLDTEIVLADAEAMRRAVLCCYADQDRAFLMNAWNPIAPSGGCAGGTMQVVVEFDRPCCPAESPA